MKEVREEIKRIIGAEFEIICLDLSIPDSASLILKKVKQRKLSADILINNAGFSTKGLFTKNNQI